MMKQEKEREYYGKTTDDPVCQAHQSLYLAQRRAEIAVAQDGVITMAGHAIAFDDHALLFAPGMMIVADVALAADTLPVVEIMRDQIRGPLSGMHWLAANIADILFGFALQGVGAWLVLIEGKMLNTVAMMALWAPTCSHFFAQMTGLFRVLLKHQGSPPDCVVWLRQSQRCAGV